MFVLAWWFDWLPHHDLEDTQQENRYRATRNRVGSEWILTPLLLSQNYHLVHHLHPSIPFHRYVATWRRNEEAYLERDAAIGTVFGQQLDPDEYREWKRLNGKLARLLPVRMPKRSSAHAAVFHPVPVASVDRLTDDSVLIRFDVPDDLRDQFSFEPGQHVTVRTDLGGEGVRRNYSICSPATSDTLAIAVKHIPGGAFSTFAMEQLRAGDTLELMTPTGSFGTPLDPLADEALRGDRRRQRHHPGPLDPADDARRRDRESLHPGLRQPGRGQHDVPRRAGRPRGALRRPAPDHPRALPRSATPGAPPRSRRPPEARAVARLRPGRRLGRRVVPVWTGRDGDRPARRCSSSAAPSRTASTSSSSTATRSPRSPTASPRRRSRSACAAASTRSRWQPATPSSSPR